MDWIIKKIVNMVNIYHLVIIDFEEQDTIEFEVEDDSPASISSGNYEDPETNKILLDVTYECPAPSVRANVYSSSGIYEDPVEGDRRLLDITYERPAPSVRANVTYPCPAPSPKMYCSTPAIRDDGAFNVYSSPGNYEDPEDNRQLDVTYECPAVATLASTPSSISSLEEDNDLALALASTTYSISSLEDSVFL